MSELTPHMAAGLMVILREECERQHARAEAAEQDSERYAMEAVSLTERLMKAEAELSTLQVALEQATKERDEALTPHMAAGLLTVLKAECEKQHERAEKAEAALDQVQGELPRCATCSHFEWREPTGPPFKFRDGHVGHCHFLKTTFAYTFGCVEHLAKPTTPEREER